MAVGTFTLGKILISERAFEIVSFQDIDICLSRHASGDWGDEMSVFDRRQNLWALTNGLQILSIYSGPLGVRICVVTNSTRSETVVLLADEYCDADKHGRVF